MSKDIEQRIDAEIISRMLAYDPFTRGLRDKQAFDDDYTFKDTRELGIFLTKISSDFFSTPEDVLVREISEIFRYRVMFLLLPHECLFGDPVEDKPIIREHLISLGLTVHEPLVSAIKFFCVNFRAAKEKTLRKKTITDIYIKHPNIYRILLDKQRGRCDVCGEVLEYGRNMQLDHILPWYMGDDPSDGSNWQLLCDLCNRGKGMYPHYSLQTVLFNWIRPKFSGDLREDVRYAVLTRDKRCQISGLGPKEARLVVIKRVATGCFVLDNLKTVAES